jgi:hypothetical protein
MVIRQTRNNNNYRQTDSSTELENLLENGLVNEEDINQNTNKNLMD